MQLINYVYLLPRGKNLGVNSDDSHGMSDSTSHPYINKLIHEFVIALGSAKTRCGIELRQETKGQCTCIEVGLYTCTRPHKSNICDDTFITIYGSSNGLGDY